MPGGFDFRLSSKADVPLILISHHASCTTIWFNSEPEIVYVHSSCVGSPMFDEQDIRISSQPLESCVKRSRPTSSEVD